MVSHLVNAFIPEIFLSFFILFSLISNSFLINTGKFNYPLINKEIFSQIFFIFICLLILFLNNKIEGYFFFYLFLNDFNSKIIKLILIFTSLFLIFPIHRSFVNQALNFFEYYTIFLLSLLSLFLLVCASDMLSFYLLIELQALSFYVLACFKRNSTFSSEAGLNYFISGSFISGIFLFGCSILFILLGTLNFNSLLLLLTFSFQDTNSVIVLLLTVTILLITFVFFFKISVVPFHFWSPDVYDSAPLSSTLIFSLLPKIVLFYIFFKWIYIVKIFSSVQFVLNYCGLASLIYGSCFALYQKNFKRLIILSSIAQTGFIITTLSSINLSTTSISSIFFFLLIYILSSILVWSNFSLLSNFHNKVSVFKKIAPSNIYTSNLFMLFLINKSWAVLILILFFSLAGIPPLVGFFSKFLIVSSLVQIGNFGSGFILFVVGAISVFYYLRIIKIVFFERNKLIADIDFSQVIFKDMYLFFELFILTFLSYLLIFFFIFPNGLFKISCLIKSCLDV